MDLFLSVTVQWSHKVTKEKYRKVFLNNKLTQEEKELKVNILQFIKKELNAKITFKKDSKQKDIEHIELI